MLFVPAGDYPITEKIRIRGERSGLFGPGRIVQQNQDQPIIEIENAQGTEIRDLTLMRPEGKMETRKEGLIAQKCSDLVIENVRVIDNHSKSGAILVTDSRDTRISRCLVRNYMCVAIDDRTQGTAPATPSAAPTAQVSWCATAPAPWSRATVSWRKSSPPPRR